MSLMLSNEIINLGQVGASNKEGILQIRPGGAFASLLNLGVEEPLDIRDYQPAFLAANYVLLFHLLEYSAEVFRRDRNDFCNINMFERGNRIRLSFSELSIFDSRANCQSNCSRR